MKIPGTALSPLYGVKQKVFHDVGRVKDVLSNWISRKVDMTRRQIKTLIFNIISEDTGNNHYHLRLYLFSLFFFLSNERRFEERARFWYLREPNAKVEYLRAKTLETTTGKR